MFSKWMLTHDRVPGAFSCEIQAGFTLRVPILQDEPQLEKLQHDPFSYRRLVIALSITEACNMEMAIELRVHVLEGIVLEKEA
jgi:hypothetical protein